MSVVTETEGRERLRTSPLRFFDAKNPPQARRDELSVEPTSSDLEQMLKASLSDKPNDTEADRS